MSEIKIGIFTIKQILEVDEDGETESTIIVEKEIGGVIVSREVEPYEFLPLLSGMMEGM